MPFHPKITYQTAEEPRDDAFIDYFANRVLKNNKNFLCAVTGQTGSGKSWLSGSIGETYSKKYNIPYNPTVHTFFKLKDLLKLINSPDVDDVIRPGSFLHFDEPQVEINSRQWQSESNNIMNVLTSTFRNKRLIVFFATPYMQFLDKQTRILFHAEIKVNGYDKTKGLTSCKPRFLEWVPSVEDFYYKRLKIFWPSSQRNGYDKCLLQDWQVGKPSAEWIALYEAQKKKFSDDINLELARRLEGKKNKDKQEDSVDKLKKLVDMYNKGETNAINLALGSGYSVRGALEVLKELKKSPNPILLS